MRLQTFLHLLPTRHRNDGHHENYISRISSRNGRKSLQKSSTVIALSTLAITMPLAKAEPKPVGTWGWTTGGATYVRIRPGQQTPIVAKVARRTQLMVWGTFNGWYRVETTDHKFGWIRHDYVNVPKADKLRELSHFKAKKASDNTGNQVLYGKPEQLKKYYAKYKSAGAKKGLAKQGITLVATPKPKKAKIVLAATKTKKPVAKTAARPVEKPAHEPVVVTVSAGNTSIASSPADKHEEKARTVAVETPRKEADQKAPDISPSEIMAAREKYIRSGLASRHKKAPYYMVRKSQPVADVLPTAVDPDAIRTSPTPIKNGSVSSSTPISGKPAKPVKAAINRGGSPRDMIKWAQANNKFGEGMAKQALSYRGMPYISGSANPSRGFDCSGLVYYLLRSRGYNPPRTSDSMVSVGKPVSKSELKPGDIVFFANTYKSGVSHVGVYTGNNNFVHAANSGAGVRVDSLTSGYYGRKYWGARRVK